MFKVSNDVELQPHKSLLLRIIVLDIKLVIIHHIFFVNTNICNIVFL